MSELNKQFEALPEINEILKGGQYKFISNECGYYSDVEGVSTEAIDLSWYAFQEQQKKINTVTERLDQWMKQNTWTRYQAGTMEKTIVDIWKLLK